MDHRYATVDASGSCLTREAFRFIISGTDQGNIAAGASRRIISAVLRRRRTATRICRLSHSRIEPPISYNRALGKWPLEASGAFWDAIKIAHKSRRTGMGTSIAILDGWIDDRILAWQDAHGEEADLSQGGDGPPDYATGDMHSADPELFSLLKIDEKPALLMPWNDLLLENEF